MPSLKKLFDNGKRRYQELRDGAEGAIVRREWATFGRHWLEPYYAESNCFGLGALVSLPIDDTRGLVEHGFDAAGRLRVVRNYNALKKCEWLPGRGPERPAKEQYFDYADDEVIATLFDHDEKKPVINVARYRYEGTQLVEVQTRYKNGSERTETFEWADGRPVRARVSHPGMSACWSTSTTRLANSSWSSGSTPTAAARKCFDASASSQKSSSNGSAARCSQARDLTCPRSTSAPRLRPSRCGSIWSRTITCYHLSSHC
ncbi:MAG: hypothetical protein R3B07_23240 [Polyangiaceae bacterium]